MTGVVSIREVGPQPRYKLFARPDEPVLLQDVPETLATYARLVRFDSIRFASASSIDVPLLVECLQPQAKR